MDTNQKGANQGAASGIQVIVHGTAWHPQQREIQDDPAKAALHMRPPADVVICVCPCVEECSSQVVDSAAPPTRDDWGSRSDGR